VKTRWIVAITFLILMTVQSTTTLSVEKSFAQTNSTELLLLTPNPNTWPGTWTAEQPSPTEIGTTSLTLHYPQTEVDEVFFLNVTIRNVENMKSWGVGVIFDRTKLIYKGARRPPDHVFKPVQDMGWTLIAPAVAVDELNETHSIIKWGCAYIMGDPPWSFTGSGTLCQIKFGIKREVNQTHPKWSTVIAFDPEWTSIFLYPSGKVIPEFHSEKVKYLYPITPTTMVLSFTPKRVTDVSLLPCNSFNINLTATNAMDLHRWRVELFYLSGILNITNVSEGIFLRNYGSTVFNVQINRNYNTTHGQIILEQYLLITEGAYGSGCLATMTFHVISMGETPILIVNEIALNSDGQNIPHIVEGGYFSNILKAKIEVNPVEIRDPSLIPGQEFSINITIDDVEDLKNCTFKLVYNPDILLETTVIIPRILGQIPIKKVVIDDFEGTILVNIAFTNPITVYEKTVITIVTFEVQALGVSPLNLTETQLKNSKNQAITHEFYNGIFIGLIRDVAVIQVVADKLIVYQGWLVHINVSVANYGNLTETFELELYCNTTFIDKRTVTLLEPGENLTVTFNLDTATLSCGKSYIITAKIPAVPYEINISNNALEGDTIKIKLMGDINGDNMVNMADITIILNAYGSFPGHPRWNSDADLFQDNKIDISDLILIIDNFGKRC